jgi:hypothetical protein
MPQCYLGLLGDLLVDLSLCDRREGVSAGRVDLGAHLHGLVGGLVHKR